jgi:hypothetical protein
MNLSEFKNEFQISYNSIATSSAPNIDDYELSVYLTKAQLELIKDYYNPNGNKYKEGFESSEKRRVDLKELITSYNNNTYFTSSKAIHKNSKFFNIPDNVFLIINETAEILNNGCDKGKITSIKPITHDEFSKQIFNPFKRPNKYIAWRLDFSKIDSKNIVEIISEYDIKYQLRYIKYPKPIIISNLNTTFPGEGLTINGLSSLQECELNQEVHPEILDRAVELALRDYKPSNLESKIQLDQRNE